VVALVVAIVVLVRGSGHSAAYNSGYDTCLGRTSWSALDGRAYAEANAHGNDSEAEIQKVVEEWYQGYRDCRDDQ
jgi:hypothetical protein